MAKRRIKCKKCSRTFLMAAHLGRHMNTIHGSKRKGRTSAGLRSGNAKVGNGRRTRLPAMVMTAVGSSADGLLGNMHTYHSDLLAQRQSIDVQIEAVARAMEAMGAAAPSATGMVRTGRRGRPPGRPGSLKDFIVRVLRASAQPLSPNQIGRRVKSAGYKTKAKDLTKAVSNTLPDLKQIKRVGFGSYQLG